jgi:two-component system sensor histidine kinase HydH
MGPEATGVTPREQRLAAAGRVAAGLLHEWRNVLSPISNLAYVLEQQADDPEKVRDLARRLAALTQARSRVAERLRDFLRQDAVRFPEDTAVDVSTAARETVALCTTLAASRPGLPAVRIECDVSREVIVQGDGADLRTAILELVLNALDALPGGGTVQVRTWASEGLAVLEVRDDGRGLPAGIADGVFDPFISTRSAPDAGLGLSAAWGIARRHGGDLTIDGPAAGGTTVTLKIPLSFVDI